MEAQKLVDKFIQKVDEHERYLVRVLLTDLERELSADNLAATLANRRFIQAVQADVRDWIMEQPRFAARGRLSTSAARAVASALTEPMRAAAFRKLATAVRRRAENPKFVKDANEYKAAVSELVEKELRAIITRHVRQFGENMKALLPLLLHTRGGEIEGAG